MRPLGVLLITGENVNFGDSGLKRGITPPDSIDMFILSSSSNSDVLPASCKTGAKNLVFVSVRVVIGGATFNVYENVLTKFGSLELSCSFERTPAISCSLGTNFYWLLVWASLYP